MSDKPFEDWIIKQGLSNRAEDTKTTSSSQYRNPTCFCCPRIACQVTLNSKDNIQAVLQLQKQSSSHILISGANYTHNSTDSCD